jgi:hypothetical protein
MGREQGLRRADFALYAALSTKTETDFAGKDVWQ